MPVTSLVQAITRIGGKEMARLAIASGLGAHARAAGPLASLKRRIWLDGLAGAALCQELARKRLLDVEEAFVCGLLHDFGRMIAVACVEEILAGHPGQRAMPLEYWLEVVDRYHVELGLVLAAKWDLPQMVSDVISLHHTDPQGAEEPRMVELVMAADEVVRMLGESIALTPEDLGTVSLLTGPECELVSRVLDRLPAFIASFEGEAPAPPPGQSLVEAEPPTEEGMAGPRPVDFEVEITAGRDKRRYRAMGIATNNRRVNGAAPLPENEGHTVLLQPFALNGKAHEAWKEILRRTTTQA
jgi:putative nucleotidyltransferase with HDIG domain